MGVRGFDLLELAVSRNFRVAMLTAHALTAEALKRSFEMKARAYLPKEKLGEVVPFLEDVLKYEYLPGGSGFLEKLKGFLTANLNQTGKRRRVCSGKNGTSGSRRGRRDNGILEYWNDGSIDGLRTKGGDS